MTILIQTNNYTTSPTIYFNSGGHRTHWHNILVS